MSVSASAGASTANHRSLLESILQAHRVNEHVHQRKDKCSLSLVAAGHPLASSFNTFWELFEQYWVTCGSAQRLVAFQDWDNYVVIMPARLSIGWNAKPQDASFQSVYPEHPQWHNYVAACAESGWEDSNPCIEPGWLFIYSDDQALVDKLTDGACESGYTFTRRHRGWLVSYQQPDALRSALDAVRNHFCSVDILPKPPKVEQLPLGQLKVRLCPVQEVIRTATEILVPQLVLTTAGPWRDNRIKELVELLEQGLAWPEAHRVLREVLTPMSLQLLSAQFQNR